MRYLDVCSSYRVISSVFLNKATERMGSSFFSKPVMHIRKPASHFLLTYTAMPRFLKSPYILFRFMSLYHQNWHRVIARPPPCFVASPPSRRSIVLLRIFAAMNQSHQQLPLWTPVSRFNLSRSPVKKQKPSPLENHHLSIYKPYMRAEWETRRRQLIFSHPRSNHNWRRESIENFGYDHKGRL